MAKNFWKVISEFTPANIAKYANDPVSVAELRAKLVGQGYQGAEDLTQDSFRRLMPNPDTGVMSKDVSPFAEEAAPIPTKSVLNPNDIKGQRLTKDQADSAQNIMDIESVKRGSRSMLKTKPGSKKKVPEAAALKESRTAPESEIQDIMSRVKAGTYSYEPFAASYGTGTAINVEQIGKAEALRRLGGPDSVGPRSKSTSRKKGTSLGIDEAVMKPVKADAAQQELDDVIAELDKATPDAAVMKPTKVSAPIEPAPAAAPPVDVPATKPSPTTPEQPGIPDPVLSQLRPKGMPMPTSTIPETSLVPYTGALKGAPATPPAQLQLPAESATTAQDWAQLGRQTNPLDINWGDKIGSSSPEAIPLPARSASSMQQDWAQLGRSTDPSTIKFDAPVGGSHEQLSNMPTRRVPAKGEVAEVPPAPVPTQIPPKSNLLRNSLLGAGVLGAAGTGGALLSSYGAEQPTITPALGGSSTTPPADTNALGILGVPPGPESSQQGMNFGDQSTSQGMTLGGGRVKPGLGVKGTALPIQEEGKNLGLSEEAVKGFESIKSMPTEVQNPLMDRLAALNAEARQIQTDLSAKIDASQNQYEANSNKVALAEFGANLAQSLAKIGAAVYGLRNNMDISSHLKMDPVSMNRQMDRVFQEHQMRMSRYTDAAKVASADIKEERQGIQEEISADKKAKAAAAAADIKMKFDEKLLDINQKFEAKMQGIKNDDALTQIQKTAELKSAGDKANDERAEVTAQRNRANATAINAADNASREKVSGAGKEGGLTASQQENLDRKDSTAEAKSQADRDKKIGEFHGAVAALKVASPKDRPRLIQAAMQVGYELGIPEAQLQTGLVEKQGQDPGFFAGLTGAKGVTYDIPPPAINPRGVGNPAQQGAPAKKVQGTPKPDGFYDEEQDGKVYRVKYQGGERVGVTAK